ncbi:hypothetical protein C8250_020740 [Streptomyces sp. So13.3]|uniref:hypothetical protein n=1 Tax=Streptomyces TaxID=1883 RepID=UPI0011069542|nr:MULTISPECIES: hypothetical protein [Streptomyces]MCZ4099515.1 hypothetical protein [Streptomyces sp. H39-C1]QNA74023.1 hypothetical protein C8250_020740 [Streptomyces sp. So13.3]
MSQPRSMHGFVVPAERSVHWVLSLVDPPVAGDLVTDYAGTARDALDEALATHLAGVEDAEERRELVEQSGRAVSEWLAQAFSTDNPAS